MSPEVAKQYGAKLEQEAPFATPDELPQYEAIIFEMRGALAGAHPGRGHQGLPCQRRRQSYPGFFLIRMNLVTEAARK